MPVITRNEKIRLIKKSEGNDEPPIEIVKLYDEIDNLEDNMEDKIKSLEMQYKIMFEIMFFLLINQEIKFDMSHDYYNNLIKESIGKKEKIEDLDLEDEISKNMIIESLNKFEHKVIYYRKESSNGTSSTIRFLVGFYVLFFAVVAYFYYAHKHKVIQFDYLYN